MLSKLEGVSILGISHGYSIQNVLKNFQLQLSGKYFFVFFFFLKHVHLVGPGPTLRDLLAKIYLLHPIRRREVN